MNIGKLAVTRPVAVTMRIAALVLLGWILLQRLPIDLLPKVDIPTVVVNVNWPNTGPSEMETQITRPIEAAVSAVKGLNIVSSTSSLGSSNVRCQFNYGVNVDQASIEVMQQVQRAQSRFPSDPTISVPNIFKFDPSSLPILIYGVGSETMDLTHLRSRLINEISPQIEAAGGVAAVTVGGGQDRAIMVEVDPAKLEAHGLSIAAVSKRLSEENVTEPAGVAQEGKTQYNIRSVGYFKTLDEMRNLPMGTYGGKTVLLKEIANVRDGSQDILSYTRSNLEPALSLSITRQSDANTVEVVRNVREVVNRLQSNNPDLKFDTTYDQSAFIEHSIKDLQQTALIGAVLAIGIITFFLRNLRSTFVVGLSIPISIISTFALMYFYHFTLNTISLAGLALATGLIVDDAIVVLENIYRHIEKDRSRAADAAVTGTNEIFSAVLASTFTVMIVFLPLLLLSGQTGQVFTQFALVVVFSIGISLLDATTIVPMLSARMIKEKDIIEEAHPEERDPNVKLSRTTKIFDRIGQWLHNLDTAYRNGLEWSLRHRGKVVLGGVFCVILAAVLWPFVGKEQLPQSDSGNINVRLKLPIGTPVDTTNTVMLDIEKKLLADPDVETVLAGAGANVGLRGAGGGAPQEGSATIKLKDNRKSNTATVIRRLQRQFANTPGARVLIQPLDIVQNILGNNTGFSIDVYGQDLTELNNSAQQVLRAMSAVPGLMNVDTNVQDALPEIQWNVDRDKAQALGVSFLAAANVIANATNGQLSTYFQEGGFQYPIYVQVARDLRLSPEQLKDLTVVPATAQHPAVTLGQFASPVYGTGPNQISRQKGQRLITVSGNVQDRPTGEVQADVEAALNKLTFPPSVHWELGFQQQNQAKEFSGLGVSVFLAVALIYMLLATQFESFIYPLIVLVTVPLCAIGLVLALFLTNRSFGLTAFIGLLMLIGIVVKNGILLVDYTNQLRARGMTRHDAILTAGPTRLRPILMTTICAILGMMPLASGLGQGSELYVPLATAVIGGLATSTLLTLFIVPTVYTFFDDLSSRFSPKKDLARPQLVEPTVAAVGAKSEIDGH
ncbi:MAG: efflux RND transporter permease subunit [Armatimonadetes bacterium]|nr:efflux RND transporter permease subunit [Armatimonadota bacterium]